MRIPILILTTLATAGILVVEARAHSGTYKGPEDVVPPGGEGSGTPPPPTTGPVTPPGGTPPTTPGGTPPPVQPGPAQRTQVNPLGPLRTTS